MWSIDFIINYDNDTEDTGHYDCEGYERVTKFIMDILSDPTEYRPSSYVFTIVPPR